jgi:hypothetical protein
MTLRKKMRTEKNFSAIHKIEKQYEQKQQVSKANKIAAAESYTVELRHIDITDAVRNAAERFNFVKAEDIRKGNTSAFDPYQSPNSLSMRQRAVTAAYIRHSYTNYENALSIVADGGRAYATLKAKYMSAIIKKYPQLRNTHGNRPKQTRVPIHVPEDFSVDGLEADERQTVLLATNDVLLIDDLPLSVLIDNAHQENPAGVLLDASTNVGNQLNLQASEIAVATHAVRNHSNLEAVALPYLNRRGFTSAWDLLHASVLEAFAHRYPSYAHAFRSVRNLDTHDWQQKTFTLSWDAANREPRSAELRVTRTSLEHLLDAPTSRLPYGYEPAGLMAALETCFQDYTNFNYEIAFLYEADFKAEPSLRHELTVQVLNAIAETYPQLRAVADRRIQELNTDKEKREAEQAKKQAERDQETQDNISKAQIAQSQVKGFKRNTGREGGGGVAQYVGSFEKERKRVRHEALMEEQRLAKEARLAREQLEAEDEKKRKQQEKSEAKKNMVDLISTEAIQLMLDVHLDDEIKAVKRHEIATIVLALGSKYRRSFIGRVSGQLPYGRELYDARKSLPWQEQYERELQDTVWEFEKMCADYPELKSDIITGFNNRMDGIRRRIDKYTNCQPTLDQLT